MTNSTTNCVPSGSVAATILPGSSLGGPDPNWETPWLMEKGDPVTWIGIGRLRRLEEELAQQRVRKTRKRGPDAHTLKACRIANSLHKAGQTWREIDKVFAKEPYSYSAGTIKRLVRRYRSLL
jgi:hypothetical protein